MSDFEKIINRRSGIKMGGFAVYDLRFAVYDNANDGIQDWLNARRHLYLSNTETVLN